MAIVETEFICLRFPLSSEELALAERARELHREELDSEAREFPDLTFEENWLIMVVIDGDRVVGYASAEMFPRSEGEWYVKWMVIAHDSRNRGLGSRLLGAIATAALHDAAPALLLEPWRDGEPYLEAFYISRGFEWVDDPTTTLSRYLAASPTSVISRTHNVESISLDEYRRQI